MKKSFQIYEQENVDIYGIGLKIHRAALAKIRRRVNKKLHNERA